MRAHEYGRGGTADVVGCLTESCRTPTRSPWLSLHPSSCECESCADTRTVIVEFPSEPDKASCCVCLCSAYRVLYLNVNQVYVAVFFHVDDLPFEVRVAAICAAASAVISLRPTVANGAGAASIGACASGVACDVQQAGQRDLCQLTQGSVCLPG